MHEIFEWDSDDDFFDEEDTFINKNDPFAKERDGFAPYEYSTDDTEQDGFLEAMDDFDVEDAMAGGSIIGGMISDEEVSDTEIDQFADRIERISMREANQGPKSSEDAPLRPFERWVKDVLEGRKTWSDDL